MEEISVIITFRAKAVGIAMGPKVLGVIQFAPFESNAAALVWIEALQKHLEKANITEPRTKSLFTKTIGILKPIEVTGPFRSNINRKKCLEPGEPKRTSQILTILAFGQLSALYQKSLQVR